MGRLRLTSNLVVVLIAIVTLGSACASGGDEVRVSAAASLTEVFADLAEAFEEQRPDTEVVLNIAGSSALREQVLEGAPTDVLAAASESAVAVLVERGVLTDPTVFATNTLAIATPAGNPGGVIGLDDFSRDALLVGVCAPGVPCGDYAREVLGNAGVDAKLDTNEPTVRALLTKIEAGELDAGIVYRTDVSAASVDAIEIAASLNVTATYPIGVVADGPNPHAAAAFVEFVRSPLGQEILTRHGFGVP